ncbi:YeaH/YhbH family protein [Cognatishimia sp. SS12]|uniref:YeaH/YhbH family protein n=1 Tax=Cognatishimia sp. SS12 TaxID=2979465 RepID=UPI00232FFB54|nr:YeaH/YhbH family protein [Cognatishimia sp. SS12]MDC0738808.1 YeaH/YhbH family protein [Cognatishimia sp. SS12]
MHHFIDRRPNPKGKSLGNRQRFLRRAKENIKKMVDRSVRQKSVTDADPSGGEEVTIPAKGIKEPFFASSPKGGFRRHVLPGNKDFVVGDAIPRPKGGAGEGGRKASEDGEGEDGFSFTLTRDEYLEILFEGLELPDLVKKNTFEMETSGTRRAGLTTAGTPNNLNLVRTMRNSLGRRIALRRPSQASFQAVVDELAKLEDIDAPDEELQARIAALQEKLALLERRRKLVGYIDPIDLRFDTHVPEKIRNSKAVVFCLMDVSGSMQEREKDLAKRFFMLLHLFLERAYEHTEVVFIRHTHHAQEVDEETFFYARETGGTIVSTALKKMQEIIEERYPVDEWNIYGAQASDGENFGNDSEKCRQILSEVLLPSCQYYAYVEIVEESDEKLLADAEEGADLWQNLRQVEAKFPQFEIRRVAEPGHIYPIFRELFAAGKSEGR